MSLNKVMLIGNVGRDPEIRYLEGNGQNGQGTKVATFTLATSERYKDRSGETRENTEWHNIVAWRQNADVCERFVKKGTQLFIEGRLRTRNYTDQSGAKRYVTEITVDTLQLLGRKDDNPAAQGYQQPAYQQSYQQPQQNFQPAQPAYQPAQPSFQQPAYQQPKPVAQPAPAMEPQPIDLGIGDGTDDLPF